MASKVINSALLAGAFQNFNVRFQQGYKTAPIWWKSVAMEVPSGTTEEVYAWLQKLPRFRKWVGPRVVNRLAENAYRLRNEKWEDTIAVARESFEDDKLGLYAPMFEMFGQASAKFVDQNTVLLLTNGTSSTLGLCFDGNPFFYASHPVDMNDATKGTYSNRLTSTALTKANFETAYAAFAAIKAEDGQPMGLLPDTLFVPPALRATALAILKAGVVAVTQGSGAAAVTNVNLDLVKVVIISELAGVDDTTWYLGVCDSPVKPLIFQNRMDGPLVQRFSETDPNVFDNDEYIYGQRKRAAFGYALPFLLMRCEA